MSTFNNNFVMKCLSQKAHSELNEFLKDSPIIYPDDIKTDVEKNKYKYDRENAFEHAYTSAYLSTLIGEDAAIAIGYAKEIFTEKEEINRLIV